MAFNLIPLLVQLIVGVLVSAVGYLLMPKVKSEKTSDVTDMEAPTAEAGRPIPVVFGELEVKGINILFFTDKETTVREVEP